MYFRNGQVEFIVAPYLQNAKSNGYNFSGIFARIKSRCKDIVSFVLTSMNQKYMNAYNEYLIEDLAMGYHNSSRFDNFSELSKASATVLN